MEEALAQWKLKKYILKGANFLLLPLCKLLRARVSLFNKLFSDHYGSENIQMNGFFLSYNDIPN